MATYEIHVQRRGAGEGTLTFKESGRPEWSTPCWEDPGKLIPLGTYTGCSTTVMAKKGYKGVYIPDSQTGRVGIFVHKGTSSAWSDGCIVCEQSKIEKIYDTVPVNGCNITVKVSG